MSATEQYKAVIMLIRSIFETIAETCELEPQHSEGCPLSPMYLALQQSGVGHQEFMMILGKLDEMGMIEVTSTHAKLTEKGRLARKDQGCVG